jgi:hypothetical protein
VTARAALACALAALGIALASWLARERPGLPATRALEAPRDTASPLPSSTTASREEVAALRELLLEEAVARERLEAEVAELRAVLTAPRDAGRGGPAAAAASSETPWFDDASLRSAGLPADEIARMRERFEALEMESLELRDRATREGWLGTPRFADESRALEERRRALRDELGDDRFDWYLYAQDRPNRVEIRDVLSSSPAAKAGLQAGDLVVRYDGDRVFALDELVRATAAGRAGEQVALELDRRGEPVRAFVPRGPLGVRLGARRVRP